MRQSHWDKYVIFLALDLIMDPDRHYDLKKPLEVQLLNGAPNWKEYSWGGCGMIYDREIAAHACTDGEWKRTKGGQKAPNSKEQWLDVQARGYYQAAGILLECQRQDISIEQMIEMYQVEYDEIIAIANSRL
ncbi:MAG: hypothetical protein MJZ34_13770 [Paludibacteraceae bacterium]|nr:hypothetical protein [Paludibacteraceae bacterium]